MYRTELLASVAGAAALIAGFLATAGIAAPSAAGGRPPLHCKAVVGNHDGQVHACGTLTASGGGDDGQPDLDVNDNGDWPSGPHVTGQACAGAWHNAQRRCNLGPASQRSQCQAKASARYKKCLASIQ